MPFRRNASCGRVGREMSSRPSKGRSARSKKFLTDRKIPARLGHSLPLVACGNVVYAVCGVEISDAVRITERTVRRGALFTPMRTPETRYKGVVSMHPDCERILITEEQLAAKVKEAGRWITEHFRGKSPVAVCNLKGEFCLFPPTSCARPKSTSKPTSWPSVRTVRRPSPRAVPRSRGISFPRWRARTSSSSRTSSIRAERSSLCATSSRSAAQSR